MEKLPTTLQYPHLVLGIILCLLVHSQGHPNNNPLFFTLYCQNMSLNVKGDQVTLSRGRPTLYSLLTPHYYQDENSTNGEDNLSMSLEAVATGKLICMDKDGKVYSWNSRSKKDGKFTTTSTSNDKMKPPGNCLFKKLKFSTHYIYRDARAIFCPTHSNATVGQFLTFSEDGAISGVQRRYDALNTKDDNWVKLQLGRANAKMRNLYLKQTSFSKDNKFNSKVRKCIARQIPHLFPTNKMHTKIIKIRHEGGKSLKRIIPKCKRRIERKLKNGVIKARLRTELEEMEMEGNGSNEVGVDFVKTKPNLLHSRKNSGKGRKEKKIRRGGNK